MMTQCMMQTCAISLCSEELLGMYEKIQIYFKLKLVVPLRLLHVNSLKHSLARDVSLFKLLLFPLTV